MKRAPIPTWILADGTTRIWPKRIEEVLRIMMTKDAAQMTITRARRGDPQAWMAITAARNVARLRMREYLGGRRHYQK